MPDQLKLRTPATLFFAAVFATLAAAQTTLLHADFNQCSLPAGWTVNLSGNGPAGWYVTDSPQNPNTDGTTIDGTCMAVFDDELFGPNEAPGTVQFISPPFDATFNSVVTLSVDVHFLPWGGSKFSIYAFDGSRYVLLKKFQADGTGQNFSDFTNFTADLSFFAHEKMRLLFEFDDGGEARHAGFDNVKVTGTGHGANVLLETFDFCSKPNGWDTDLFSGDRNWKFSTFYNDDTDTVSINGSCFASFDDDGNGNALENAPPSRAILLSPWIDGTEYANFTLSFDVVFQKKTARERLEIGVWDGAGLRIAKTFDDDLGGPLFESFSNQVLDLSLFRAEEFRVVFIYDDGGGWGKWAGIDNVKITGEGSINDLCETAFTIHLNEKCRPGANHTAFLSGGQPECLPPHSPVGDDQAAVNAIWYHYPAAKNGWVEVATAATFNDILTVFEGSCNGGVTAICTNRDEFGFTGETACFEAMAGMDYFIRVGSVRGAYGQEFGSLCIQLSATDGPPAAPPNDSCHLALPLIMGDECVPGNNFNASFSGRKAGLDEKPRADVWYRFEAAGEAAEILTHADFSDVISLYSGSCGMLAPLAFQEFGQKLVTRDLTPGAEYFIQIGGSFATVEGEVCVQVMPHLENPPANDLCKIAQPLSIGTECSPVMFGAGSGTDGPKPSCIEDAGPSAWFSFLAPASGKVKFNTHADFPTAVALYLGGCTNLTELKCFDNPLPCDGFQMLEGLDPGEVYYLQVVANLGFFGGGDEGGSLCLALLDGSSETIIPLDLSVTVDCLGEGVGKLQVQVDGGFGSIAFYGNADGEILYSGDAYLIVAIDENGCEKSVSGVVQCGGADCPLTAAVEVNDVHCHGQATGAAAVATQNATGTLSYLWSNGGTGPSVTGLPPGPLHVTVTDEGGCAVVLAAEVAEPAALVAQVTATAETGFQANDGAVAAYPVGGAPPYVFQWSNGSTSQAQSGLPPGFYAVTVTDANHCQTTAALTVAAFICDLDVEVFQQNVTCHNGTDGAAAAVPISGTPPFSFVWSNGKTTASVNNLPYGLITVTVTDAAGCFVALDFHLDQPPLLTANLSAVNGSALAANPSGGIPPYQFFWSNTGTTQTITGLSPGLYAVTVTDDNGCSVAEASLVAGPDCSVSTSVETIGHVTCHGGNDGFATVAMLGGTPPLTFGWPDGSFGATKTGLAAGTYAVTVTDAGQCAGIATVVIDQPPPLTGIVLGVVGTSCQGAASGEAVVSGSGGEAPYHYYWPGGVTGPVQQGLASGIHDVWIEDANGCGHLMSVAVGVDDPLPPVVSVKNMELELGEDGMATLTPAHLDNGSFDNCGIAGYALSQTQFTCDHLGPHLVTLTVLDVSGNVNHGTATVTVVDNSRPLLLCPDDILSSDCGSAIEYDLPSVEDNCLAGPPVLLEGLPPGAVFPLGETLVTYQATDLSGHTVSCSFKVVVENSLAGTIEVVPPACFGEAGGTATISPIGGTGVFNYQWNDNAGQTAATASGLRAGIYQVTVTDGGGCTFEAEALLPQPPQLLLELEGTVAASSGSASDGSISVAVSGGVPPYAFEWTASAGQFVSSEEDPSGLPGGEYLLKVEDANGCKVISDWIRVEMLTGMAGENKLERIVQVYPNPTSGGFFVKSHAGTYLASFGLFDVSGQQVWDITGIEMQTGTAQRFDLSGLANGVYLLKIIAGGEVAIKKVVLTK